MTYNKPNFEVGTKPYSRVDLLRDIVRRSQEMADLYRRSHEETTERYGEGVRPGWVSTDLAIDMHKEAKWQRRADRARGLLAKAEGK